jgi:hypothetical protein
MGDFSCKDKASTGVSLGDKVQKELRLEDVLEKQIESVLCRNTTSIHAQQHGTHLLSGIAALRAPKRHAEFIEKRSRIFLQSLHIFMLCSRRQPLLCNALKAWKTTSCITYTYAAPSL